MFPPAAYAQVKTERRRVPNYEFMISGEGDFDFVAYLREMDDAGYPRSITGEVRSMVRNRLGYNFLAGAKMCY